MRRAPEKLRCKSYSDPSRSAIGERTCDFLRGLHPARTADNVACDLHAWRIKSGTIRKMLELHSTPGTHLWIALTCVYGPEFLHAVLPSPPAWLNAAYRAERQADLEAKMAALQSELEGLR